MIQINNVRIEGHSLLVEGTVNGATVTAHGWASRISNVSDEEKKAYLELILQEQAPVQHHHVAALVSGKSMLEVRFKHWVRSNWITVATSVLLAEILRHLIR